QLPCFSSNSPFVGSAGFSGPIVLQVSFLDSASFFVVSFSDSGADEVSSGRFFSLFFLFLFLIN
ncbi:hypothetical protein, partial [Vibrio parahaemolyticus]|uniref:hypothetical protein n=1 Tax=Vibrio parahaemolyticus TaxID=670 RepID=UPI0019D701BB